MSIAVEFSDISKNYQIELKCFDSYITIIIYKTFTHKILIILNDSLKFKMKSYMDYQIEANFIFYQGFVTNLNIFEIFFQKTLLSILISFFQNSPMKKSLTKNVRLLRM